MGTTSVRGGEAASQARILRALNEIAMATAGVLDPSDLARLVVDRARDLVGGVSATLVWYGSGDQVAVLADNHPTSFPTAGLTAGQGASGQVQATGEVVVVDDYPSWAHAFDWAVADGIRSLVAVPLKAQDQVLGSLIVRSREPAFFAGGPLEALVLLSAQVAPSFQAAALAAEREHQAGVIRSLHQLAIAVSGVLEPVELARVATQYCRDLVHVDGTVIFRHDRDRRRLEALVATSDGVAEQWLRPGEGAVGIAFSERRLLAVEDYRDWAARLSQSVLNGVAACITSPLLAGDEAVGAIGLWSAQPRRWTEDEQRLVAMVAAQVGPALAAATIAKEREAHADTMRALNEVAVAAAGVLEPGELARIVAERARDLLGASGGSMTWYDAERGGLHVLADSEREFDPDRVIPIDEAGAQGACFAGGEPVAVEDYPAWERRVRDEVSRVASALVVPLQVQQRPIGTLAVNYGRPHQFNPWEVQLLSLLAASVAPTLEAARLHADLRESEARKRAIVDSAIDCVIAADEQGRIVEFNPAAEHAFGYRREEALGRDLWELIVPPQLREILRSDLEESGQAGERTPGRRLEATAQRADGSQFPVEISLATFERDGHGMLTASVRDLSERVEAEVIRRESEAKSRFVAAMSHELRTPLNSILGFSQLLSGSGTGDLNDRQLRYIGHIESSGRHLLALINDVLDLSKVEAGQMEVELEPIELQPLLEEAVGQLRPQAEQKPLDLMVDPMPQIWIRADRRRFLQVMFNLLSNALKFTPAGGLIRISAARSGRSAEVAVSDTGIGIPTAELQRIFEEFTQVERPSAQRGEGTGLGLALSKRLLQLMRGTIRVESEVGAGSTFTVTIPRIRPGDVAEARPLLLVIHGAGEDPGLLRRLEMGPYRVMTAATAREAAIIARRRRLAGIIVGEQVRPADEDWLREALRDHPRTHSLPILSAAVALHPGVLIRD